MFAGMPAPKSQAPKRDGPKDLLDLLGDDSKPAPGRAGSGLMMPPARGGGGGKPISTMGKGFGRGGFMMPPPRVRGNNPTSLAPGEGAKASVMPPPSGLLGVGSGGGGGGAKPATGPAGREPLTSLSRVTTHTVVNKANNPPGSSAPAVESSAKKVESAMAAPSTAGVEVDEDGEEAYDPRRPNDYLAFCRERLEQRDREERNRLHALQEGERERQRLRMRDERERRELTNSANATKGGDNGFSAPPPLSAGRGRGMGRGVTNLPAWMIEKKRQAEQQGGGGGPSSSGKGLPGPPPPKGTGAARQGQFEDDALPPPPALPPKNGGGGGSGGAAAAAAAAAKKRALFRNPTKVVLLKNMVGPGDVDEDLCKEVAEECGGKYGPVAACRAFEVKEQGPMPDHERVRTFVCFERQESAIKAFLGMEGRFFGGRQIRCAFFPEDRFHANDLAPKPGDANDEE